VKWEGGSKATKGRKIERSNCGRRKSELRGQEEMRTVPCTTKTTNAWRSGGVEEPRGKVGGTRERNSRGAKDGGQRNGHDERSEEKVRNVILRISTPTLIWPLRLPSFGLSPSGLSFSPLLCYSTALHLQSFFSRAFAPPSFPHPHFPNSAPALFPFVPQLTQSCDTPLIAPLLCSSCPLYCRLSILRSVISPSYAPAFLLSCTISLSCPP
jgi:hypothetical protein